MKASVEYITPEQATLMLKNNPNNRKLSESRVDRIASQMERGAWIPNGASVVMNGDALLDGQHRLSAIVKSGCTFPFVVVRGVESMAGSTIDTGKARSFSDYLTIHGYGNIATLSSAVLMHINLELGNSINTGNEIGRTYEEMEEHLRSHPEIARSVEFVLSLANRPPMSTSSLAAFHALASKFDAHLADDYVRSIAEGVGLETGSPSHHVWSRLNSRVKGQQYRLKPWQKVALVIHGWNLLRAGQKTVHHIKVGGTMRGGKLREFPVVA